MSSQPQAAFPREDVEGISTISVTDHDLELEAANQLYALVDEAMASGSTQVVLSLANVGTIKSVAIAILLRLQKQVKDAGGALKICCLRPEVLRLLKLTHADSLFEIHDTEREAVGAFLGASDSSSAKPAKTGFAINRRRFLVGAGTAIAAPIAAAAWGYDPDELTIERHRIAVPGLQRPMTAVQISDLHADRAGSCSPRLRERVAEQVGLLSPDWIFATGDYVTQPGDAIGDAAQWLADLKAREGTFAVMGNHDFREVRKAIKAKGIEVLENAWTMTHGIAVAGVNDPSYGHCSPKKALSGIPRGVGSILLAHQPDTFWTYEQPVTLQISGHTHGGQITLFGATTLAQYMPQIKRLIFETTGHDPIAHHSFRGTQYKAWAGFFRRPNVSSLLYVNRGLGRFRRLSIYCSPELTVWDLVPA